LLVDKSGLIVEIADMKPLSLDSTALQAYPLYLGDEERWFSTNGIKAGDKVRFSR